MVKIKRITCDIDRLDETLLAHAIKVFEKYGFNENIEIRISSGGKGFHVIAWNKNGVNLKKLLKIREEAGDDTARIKLDGITGREINVLFTAKKIRKITNSDEILKDAPKNI